MTKIAVALLALCLVTACGKKPPVLEPATVVRVFEKVETAVPVPVRPVAPPELLAPIKLPPLVFVAPSDPLASSALTVEGERILRAIFLILTGRDDAWRALYTGPVP